LRVKRRRIASVDAAAVRIAQALAPPGERRVGDLHRDRARRLDRQVATADIANLVLVVAVRPGRDRADPGVRAAVLGCLRDGGFSIEMTIQAYSVQDAYIYGFALQEKSVPFDTAEEGAAVAEEQARLFAEQAEAGQLAALAEEFPYLAEVVAGHVAKVGYDFTAAFEYGRDLILDALEKRRDEA
jgi:hypothetical protein